LSYSRISDHRAMVFDSRRNQAYLRALEKVITPATTVMDLGAGLGVHGLNAARLGAARVLLVEPAPVIEVARQIAADNQLHNVACFPCRVEELDLQEKVDVIVSVFTGNFLLTEDLLPSLFYARDHFLAPGGKMIPDGARMEVMPVMAAEYYQKHIESWRVGPMPTAAGPEDPALNYDAVRSYAANTMYYDNRERFNATPLAHPAPLMELDLALTTRADCDHRIEVTLTQDGICHGWLGWFQMRLLDEWLSTAGEPDATHWSPVFMPLTQPLQVKEGERLHFALQRPEFGDWTWTTDYAGQRQRQSTFLSQPLTPARLLKASDQYQPALSARGVAAQWLLARMTGEVAVGKLAAAMREHYPEIFTTEADALRFVKDLAEHYS
jgi:PRMT5 oligomerisation domain/Ribosomal protein L11 methyltransferase (PrmA)